MSYAIAEAFSLGFPYAGTPVQTLPATEVGDYNGSVALDVHGALTGRITCYVSDVQVLGAGVDLQTLLTPALEAAASTAGSQSAAPAEPAPPAADATLYAITFGTNELTVWLSIEETVIPDAVVDYDAAEVTRIENVPLDISVVVGKTTMTIAEVLSMKPGQVVDLDRSAGAPVDILVNGKHIAAGEVVVLDQDYGVKVTRVLTKPKVN